MSTKLSMHNDTDQQALFEAITQNIGNLSASFGAVISEIEGGELSDSALLQLQTHSAVMARLAVRLRQQVAENDVSQTSKQTRQGKSCS